MTARYSYNQGDTRGHRPRLQFKSEFCNILFQGGEYCQIQDSSIFHSFVDAYSSSQCSFKIARYIASSMSASTKHVAGSIKGFAPPSRSFAYLACMLYCAG